MLELLAREVRAGDAAGRVGKPERTAIAVCVGQDVAGRYRAVRPLVARSVDGQGPHRLAVETTPEPRHLELAGSVLCQPEGALHCLGAARVELQAVDAFRSDFRDLGEEVCPGLRGERAHRRLLDLGVERLAIGGMAMSERIRADAADQVDEAVPVGVLDDGPFRPLDRDAARQGEALQAGCEVLLLLRDDRLAARTGNRGFDVGGGELQRMVPRWLGSPSPGLVSGSPTLQGTAIAGTVYNGPPNAGNELVF